MKWHILRVLVLPGIMGVSVATFATIRSGDLIRSCLLGALIAIPVFLFGLLAPAVPYFLKECREDFRKNPRQNMAGLVVIAITLGAPAIALMKQVPFGTIFVIVAIAFPITWGLSLVVRVILERRKRP